MQFKQTIIGVKPTPIVASYASRGPSQYIFPNILKPDIMAPGSLVLAATSTLNKTVNVTYEISSGTSLSCPHVAGVAALLKTAHLARMECNRY